MTPTRQPNWLLIGSITIALGAAFALHGFGTADTATEMGLRKAIGGVFLGMAVTGFGVVMLLAPWLGDRLRWAIRIWTIVCVAAVVIVGSMLA